MDEAAVMEEALRSQVQGRAKSQVQIQKKDVGEALDDRGVRQEALAHWVGENLFKEGFAQMVVDGDANTGNAILRTIDRVRRAIGIKNSPSAGDIASLERLYMQALENRNGAREGDVEYALGDKKSPTWQELVAKRPVTIIDISKPQTNGSFAERRKAIRENIEGIIAKPYLNKDTGTLIFLTKESYRHAFNNIGEIQINAVEHLPDFIENSVLTHCDENTHGNPYARGVYTFFAAAKNERVYPVKLKVKEYEVRGQELPQNIKSYFQDNPQEYAAAYDTVVLEVDEITESPLGSAKDMSQYDSFQGPRELSEISVADLLNLVKGDSRKFIPPKQSQKAYLPPERMTGDALIDPSGERGSDAMRDGKPVPYDEAFDEVPVDVADGQCPSLRRPVVGLFDSLLTPHSPVTRTAPESYSSIEASAAPHTAPAYILYIGGNAYGGKNLS